MTKDTALSVAITSLDSTPIQYVTAGEGAPGKLWEVTDTVAATAAGMASTGSTYRLCRFPVMAKTA